MRTIPKSLGVTLLSVASTVSMFAGDQLFDFETDPTGVPGFVLYGNHAGSAYQFFDGNPASGGYLQLTDAAGSESCGIVFPDVDLFTNSLGQVVSLPVKAFTITMDVRVGNGTRRPADGFSISFCRQNDRALASALLPTPAFNNWAGGDSLAVASDPNGSGNPESGTKTGLAVCFDTWAGNFLPANGVINAAGNDIEGIYIRLDDVTIDSNPFVQNTATTRNGGCYITELNPGDPCGATVVTNRNTMQTGPWTGASTSTGDGGASDGTYNNLGWAPFKMEVNSAAQVTVTYKGSNFLDHLQLTNYPASQGRLILAARTGGSWEHTHLDNVRVVTTPSIQPVFNAITAFTNGFRLNILNIAQAQTTNFPFVSLDGVDVTSQVVKSNYVDVSTHGTYTQSVRFLPKSTHTVVAQIQDALGNRYTNTANFTVPAFLVLDPTNVIALAQVDTSKPGFKVKSYQSRRYQPNQLRWTEEQVIGIRGPNDADQTGAVGGFYSWDNVPKFSNGGGGNLFTNPVTPFTTFGIGNGVFPTPSVADNCAVELFGYMYFPTNGNYIMYVGSDDGFRLSFAANPLDRMGAVANEFDGGRGLGQPGDQHVVTVGQPGCYPFRMLMENGGGGADLQWFSGADPSAYTLINDTNNPGSIRVYADVLPAAREGAYVKRANPVRDAQNVVFFQPILVELGNGTGNRTVNQGSIVLKVDGTNQTLTITSPDASTTRIVSQMGTNVWTVGLHTNLLTFTDNAGTNYSYIWPFTVINVPASATVAIPLASMVPAGSVDSTKPGFRVKSYQSPHDSPNHLSWTEQQLQGLHGPNVANQQNTNGPGYFVFGADNLGSEDDGILDLINTGGGTGEWSYHKALDQIFGLGDNAFFTGTGFSGYRFNVAATKADSSALDIGAWLVFPSAGTYMIHFNSDDNGKTLVTIGNPFSKLGTNLTESSGGRGVAGSGGGQVGGDYRPFTIPAAGAFPFRFVWENGGGGAGLEVSIYKFLPDGGVAKVPLNALADPNSIKAYQTLTSGDTVAPYVSYANPPFNHQEMAYWQPVVVELTSGPGTRAINTSTIQLAIDGIVRPVNLSSPSAGVTRIVQATADWLPRVIAGHTNVLTFADNAGTNYTYTWPFTVMALTPYQNNQPAVVVNVPASSAVPISSVNHNLPGFRVYAHQSATSGAGNVQQAEEQMLGLRGANIADLSGATNGLYFVHNDVVDIGDGYNHIPGITGYDTDAARGAYRYNYSFQRFGFQKLPVANQFDTNNVALIFAGYMEFPTAGLYAMSVNSDDGFKVMVPPGNPRGQFGSILGWFDAGRGNTTGTAFGPNGSVTHFVFNIPAPGAYPIRCLWWNGGGGLDIEWTIYQFMPDGSVARTLVGDTNTPGAIKVYQDSSLSGPYVASMSPGLPYSLIPGGGQVMTLGRNQDMVVTLLDGNTTVDMNKISLTFGGVSQPLTVIGNAPGSTLVTRPGATPLPSGFYGTAVFTYVDSANRTNSLRWTLQNSDYYGTVLGGYPLGVGDVSKPGFLMRSFQADPLGSNPQRLPTRINVAEELLSGIWTNVNLANLTSNTVNGLFVLNGTGGGGSNGLINFNVASPGNSGNFSSANGYTDGKVPGIPGFTTAVENTNSYGVEVLTYLEFPTNGTYVLGVNSDDGFRVTRGWGGANNKGALVVNSPASVAGPKATAPPSLVSRLLTNTISGQIVQALGVGNGSANAAEACAITNGALLNGKIALIYRGTCGFADKVQVAAAAGALAVVIVNDRPVATAADGWFPVEVGITPIQDIPAVMIKRLDGDALVQALSNNTAVVNVTLQPTDYLVNPPTNSPVLGQADVGKGASDILFNVTVPTAGVYPIRLLNFQGGGGGNLEWFSIDSTTGNRVLINDANSPNGPGLKAFYGVTVRPTLSLQVSGGNATVNYTGTLQSASDINGPWTDVYGQPPLTLPVNTAINQFFRSR